jgi:hypothetical protein|tara:strand:+ start:302 stop:430 length:129 start_codon:yes stop_codon:yes gene_type:complete
MIIKDLSKAKKVSVDFKQKKARKMKTRGTGAATKGLMYYDKT